MRVGLGNHDELIAEDWVELARELEWLMIEGADEDAELQVEEADAVTKELEGTTEALMVEEMSSSVSQ